MENIQELIDQCLLHGVYVKNHSPFYLESVKSALAVFFKETGITRLDECVPHRIEQWLIR